MQSVTLSLVSYILFATLHENAAKLSSAYEKLETDCAIQSEIIKYAGRRFGSYEQAQNALPLLCMSLDNFIDCIENPAASGQPEPPSRLNLWSELKDAICQKDNQKWSACYLYQRPQEQAKRKCLKQARRLNKDKSTCGKRMWLSKCTVSVVSGTACGAEGANILELEDALSRQAMGCQ